ncbi:alpha-mannosidase [uncultured Friedmanniella sp.]|uniref:alpha-mannosidase n=1 Tax=uncultured Friedmanniella sp. TaxID=335381 RepID=UPI0035C9ADC6
MHDQKTLLENRLTRFVAEYVEPALYRATAPLGLSWWQAPGEPVGVEEALAQEYVPVQEGMAWGRPWSTTWIHVTGAVPEEWQAVADTSVELVVDLGFNGEHSGFQAEGLAWTPRGSTIKAISPMNNHVPLDATAPVDLYVEAAANPNVAHTRHVKGMDLQQPTPYGDPDTAGDEELYELRQCRLGLLDGQVWRLLGEIGSLDGLMRELPETLPRRAEILQALQRMLDVLDPDDIAGTAAAARAELVDVLSRPAYASAHHLTAVGHAHIDSAWLWPVRETIRKCARTFSNVVALADADPDFVFACSSAQQYAWVKEFYPELFERIKDCVTRGQFVPVGGMWVEADTNMPGGEAMARQFVAGKRFFLENFGVETEEAWLPDSFGYSAAMPGIVRASGSKYFLTQKMSWNQTNKMPHHTFWWEGIDGSRVLTHFPPVDTYNSDLSGRELALAEHQYREKGLATMSLVPFGYGDGGGGPNREMVATAHRMASVEGSPTVTMQSPRAFFDAAAAEYANPPVWTGEMYLELHSGTYTTQARTKRGNRRSEHLLREAELWASTAAVRLGAEYPYAELEELWHLVLLQQFHDILPGSGIAWVAHDAERNYAAIERRAEALIAAATTALAGEGDRYLVFNAAPHGRRGVPALGASEVRTAQPVTLARDGGDVVLDNGILRVVVDERGQIGSLIDAASGREAIAPDETALRLQLHRDLPNNWDAWDVDVHYRRSLTEIDGVDAIETEEGADAATVVVRRSFGSSTVSQRILLAAGSPSVEVLTELDWHEKHKLLKLGFPLDVHAATASAETQFGHVQRPTHANTSWEYARYETCAQRWMHVEEPGYGVVVSNDCLYGHDVNRTARADGGSTTTVRLSLVRGPEFPDPGADQGRHLSRVTIRPAAAIADAVEEGYRTNLPERVVTGAADVAPLLTVSNPAVVVEAVKLAEDQSGDVVVRLYESRGGRAAGELVAGFDVASVAFTDLLERPLGHGRCRATATGATLALRPFEILTVRLKRA